MKQCLFAMCTSLHCFPPLIQKPNPYSKLKLSLFFALEKEGGKGKKLVKREEEMTVTTLSFLSNLSTLQQLPHHSSTSLTSVITTINRYSSVGRICCRKTDDQPALVQNDGGLSRRDVLKCVGVTIGIEVLASPVSFVETASAADLIQLRQRSDFLSKVKGTLFTAIKANPELVPSILTLALNDAMTYDKATKTGGPNGSIRLSSEISRPENQGLSAALSLLEEVKKEVDSYSKGGPIAYADLIQYAAQSSLKRTFLDTAIRKCGGNEEKGNLVYTAYGSNGQWGLFEKQLGRSDTQEPDPEGRVPQWRKASVQEMKDKFTSIGFGPRQLAVMSAFLGPDQIQTEALLASDPDVLPWVQKYQRSRETVSETNYEVDLITTLTKMSTLGQRINYEAYSYPIKKVDFSKLKL